MPNIRSLRDIAPGTSLLPMPIILSLFACLLFAATLTIDFAAFRGAFALPVWLSVGNVDDARALLGAIIGAVSTVLALIFSVSLLVFSAAATQFGPRLMQRFLRDRMMQFTLGLFVATFFHALFTFIAVRQQGALQFVPQLTVITTCAMVVFSFLSLVVFNDSIASSIQTNNVLPGILDDLRDAIMEISDSRVQQAKRTNGAPKIPTNLGLRDIAELQGVFSDRWCRCAQCGQWICAGYSIRATGLRSLAAKRGHQPPLSCRAVCRGGRDHCARITGAVRRCARL